MPPGRVAFLTQLATTLPLVGLIWTIQVVHYPLFARVGATGFPGYHAEHSRSITLLVGPLMVAELCAAAASVAFPTPLLPRNTAWVGAALVAITWLATFFLAVPQHAVLAQGLDPQAITRLVDTNWVRTVAWTLRGVLLMVAVTRAVG